MDPPECLRVDLAGARSLGLPFDQVWPQAVVRAAEMSDEPADWLPILAAGREAWERAFARLPASTPEQALASVGDGLRPDRSLDARRCEQCDRWIPTDRDPRARFCGERCRRAFNYELERVRAGHASRADPSAPGWDAARAARPCEYCATNWVPLDRDRFCCSWCENRYVTAERAKASADDTHLSRP
jgi:hypothetical protein